MSIQEEESESTEIIETDDAEEETDRLAKRRVRPRNEQDQQVIDLYRSSGFQGSFQDAADIIYGRSQAPQPQQIVQDSTPSRQKLIHTNPKFLGLRNL